MIDNATLPFAKGYQPELDVTFELTDLLQRYYVHSINVSQMRILGDGKMVLNELPISSNIWGEDYPVILKASGLGLR